MRVKFVVLTGDTISALKHNQVFDLEEIESYDNIVYSNHISFNFEDTIVFRGITSIHTHSDTVLLDPDINYINITPVCYFLKSFYKKVGKHFNKYTWFPTEYGYSFSDLTTSIVESIIKDKIELVCFSVYLWNDKVSHKIAKTLKEYNSDIKIVIGGPQVDYINIDFEKHWYVDYFVYGDC